MPRLEKPSVFQRNPKISAATRAAEPWRAFKSSLAIQFNSKRQPAWDPQTLTAGTRSQIIRAIEARQSLAVAEMEFRTAIRNLVETASTWPQFRLDASVWMRPETDLEKTARRVVSESELLAAQRDELAALFERVESVADKLRLLVHGFLEVREELSGDISMTFSLGRRIMLEPLQVEGEAHRLGNLLHNATGLLIGASKKLIGAPLC